MREMTEKEKDVEDMAIILQDLLRLCQRKDIIIKTDCPTCSNKPITEANISIDYNTIILW